MDTIPGTRRPSNGEGRGEVHGLGEQFGRLRGAVEGLIRAHVGLARAEFSEIAGEVKRMLGLVGLAFALLLFALLLFSVGLPLFLGEWLFGSMGWGILHGLLFALAVAVSAVAAALGAHGRWIWLPVLSGAFVAIAVGLLLGSTLAFRGSAELAARGEAALRIDLPSGWDTVVAGAAGGAVIGALLLLVVGLVLRRSVKAAPGLLLDGAIPGAILGALCGAAQYSWQVGAAIGLTVGLIVWIAAAVAAMTRLDLSARFAGLTPTTTIDTARETWEWVRARIKPAIR